MIDTNYGSQTVNAIQALDAQYPDQTAVKISPMSGTATICQNVTVDALHATLIGDCTPLSQKKRVGGRIGLVDLRYCNDPATQIAVMSSLAKLMKASMHYANVDSKWSPEVAHRFITLPENIGFLAEHQFTAILPGVGIIASCSELAMEYVDNLPIEQHTIFRQAMLISDDGIWQRSIYLAQDWFDRRGTVRE